MKNLILSSLLLLLTSFCVWSQQLPQYTQYTLNRYIINPASAGSDNHFVGQTNYRSQWEGIKDAPRTYVLGVNGPIANQKMGIGGYVFADVTGPTQRNGLSLSYAYHLNLTERIKLSMAINAGLLLYTVDGTEIVFADSDPDVFFSPSKEDQLFPDAGFSFYLYGADYYFGASAPQLIQNQLDFENSIQDPSGRLTNHYFVTGGYNYELNENFEFEPSFLLKYVKPIPLQYEFTLRSIYQETLWLGASYRKGDAVGLLLGFVLQEHLSVGYSFDLIQSELRNYSTGTHEIMLSVKFNNKHERE